MQNHTSTKPGVLASLSHTYAFVEECHQAQLTKADYC